MFRELCCSKGSLLWVDLWGKNGGMQEEGAKESKPSFTFSPVPW